MARMTLLAGCVIIHSMIFQSGIALTAIYSGLAVIPWQIIMIWDILVVCSAMRTHILNQRQQLAGTALTVIWRVVQMQQQVCQ